MNELNCYFDGEDYVIAYSEEDATLVWEETMPGLHASRTDPAANWVLIPTYRILSAPDLEENDYKTQLVSNWIDDIGRNWFCTER